MEINNNFIKNPIINIDHNKMSDTKIKKTDTIYNSKRSKEAYLDLMHIATEKRKNEVMHGTKKSNNSIKHKKSNNSIKHKKSNNSIKHKKKQDNKTNVNTNHNPFQKKMVQSKEARMFLALLDKFDELKDKEGYEFASVFDLEYME